MQVFFMLAVHTVAGVWKFEVSKKRLIEDAFDKK